MEWMSWLMLPPVEYDKHEDDCGFVGQIQERNYIIKIKKIINFSQFIYHLIQARRDPVMLTDRKSLV